MQHTVGLVIVRVQDPEQTDALLDLVVCEFGAVEDADRVDVY